MFGLKQWYMIKIEKAGDSFLKMQILCITVWDIPRDLSTKLVFSVVKIPLMFINLDLRVLSFFKRVNSLTSPT